MSDTTDDIAFCKAQLDRERDTLEMLKKGVRLKRGTPGAPLQDVTDNHRAHAEKMVDYWKKRLALLGVHDA